MTSLKAKPIIKKRKKTTPYSAEDLKKALNDIREKKKGIRETCRAYGIPRSTIQDRLSGKICDEAQSRGPDPVLGLDGEKRVENWLLSITRCGFPIKKQDILDTVQKIVKEYGSKNPFKDGRPGQTWYSSFLKRHPELSSLAAGTKGKAATEESVRTWFKELVIFLTESSCEGILNCAERIFCGDESGFTICSKTGKVLAPKSNRIYQIKSEEKENLTVFVACNANAQIIPPLVTFPDLKSPRDVEIPDKWCLGRSEAGLMNSDVFFEYITNDFNNWIYCNCIKKPILLLVDGQKSHMSLDLSENCEKLGIILYSLPPNTNLVQPAEAIFGPLKSSWKKLARKFLSKPENSNSNITKTNFCQFFRDVLENRNMDANIKNAFSKTGIYPFNLGAIDYNCSQNSLENLRKPPKSQEITNEDLSSTRKVLKHLEPVLKENGVDVCAIFEELRKLQTQVDNNIDDTNALDDSVIFKMEYTAHDTSVANPYLPQSINDIFSSKFNENSFEEGTADTKSISKSKTLLDYPISVRADLTAATAHAQTELNPLTVVQSSFEEILLMDTQNETTDNHLSILKVEIAPDDEDPFDDGILLPDVKDIRDTSQNAITTSIRFHLTGKADDPVLAILKGLSTSRHNL